MIFQMAKGAWNKLQFKVCQVVHASVAYLDKHSTLDPVMISVVSSTPNGARQLFANFLKNVDVNSGLKCNCDLIVKKSSAKRMPSTVFWKKKTNLDTQSVSHCYVQLWRIPSLWARNFGRISDKSSRQFSSLQCHLSWSKFKIYSWNRKLISELDEDIRSFLLVKRVRLWLTLK